MADETHTLTVAVALPDRALCGNGAGRSNGYQRARLVKMQRRSAHLAAHLAMWSHDPTPYFPAGVRVRVDVLVRRDPTWAARRLDDDNLIRGLKAVMDGFTDAGVWADDRQVKWGEIAWQVADPLRGEVVLTLRPASPGTQEG